MDKTLSTISPSISKALTSWLRRVIDIHFDPKTGTPYWLEREKELGLDARQTVRFLEDLAVFGPMDSASLGSRPIEDFIPACLYGRREEILLAETAGTLGQPKFAVHREDEFELAFIKPFVLAARRKGFPRKVNWLFVGPSGPHIISKAARCCAKALDSPDPFSIDFDPRWAKKLVPGSFAAKRYLEHLEAQALRVLASQRIGVIFASPAVIDGLSEKISRDICRQIQGLHLGGMAVSVELREKLTLAFPQAVILSGYGNSLFGMMPELHYSPDTGTDYYPYGNRLIAELVEYGSKDVADRLKRPVDYEQRGQVILHRLDELQFIPNMVERDTAIRIRPLNDAGADGFCLDGLREPKPIEDEKTKPAVGLY